LVINDSPNKNDEKIDEIIDVFKVKKSLTFCLGLISVAIDGERSSKLQLIESNLITLIKNLLIKSPHINDVSIENKKINLNFMTNLIHFLYVCCYDDCCMKSRTMITTDRSILPAVGTIIGNILYSITQKNQKNTKSKELNMDIEEKLDIMKIIIEAAGLIRSIAFPLSGTYSYL
jgi:hypothetical protein